MLGPLTASSANGASFGGTHVSNRAVAQRFRPSPAVTARSRSEIGSKKGCFDCIYVYEYGIHPQTVYGQLACQTTRTNSFAGSQSPVIGPQTNKTTQDERRWTKTFTVSGVDCGASGNAVTGVRVDNANVPVKIISATVDKQPVTTVASATGASVRIPAGDSSFSLAVLIQANSGNEFAGDLNIIVDLGPSAAPKSSAETWEWMATAPSKGQPSNTDTYFDLTCDSSGSCSGSNYRPGPAVAGFNIKQSVTMLFKGTEVTVTDKVAYTVDTSSQSDVGLVGGDFEGTGTVVGEACYHGSIGEAFPYAAVVHGTFQDGETWAAARIDPSPLHC
jgi:hypothetical protein